MIGMKAFTWIPTLFFGLALGLGFACGDDDAVLDGGPNVDAGPDVGGSDAGPGDANVLGDAGPGSDAGPADGGPVFEGPTPVFHSFRISGDEPGRVYFDSSRGITGSSTEGFAISGKEILSLSVNADQLTGHYFTVSDPFTFWDNNTIRYAGGGDTGVYPFLLHYIVNDIPEPDAPTQYYVATDGDDDASGTTEESAFRTLHRALDEAEAGSTIWIKAGLYQDGRHEFPRSGEADAPIKLIGYRTTPGDIESVYYDYDPTMIAPDLDPAEMPLFDGETVARSGLVSVDKNYLIVRNLQFTRSFYGITTSRGFGYVVDRCVVKDLYGNGNEEGPGIELGATQMGDTPYAPSNYRVTDTTAINGGIGNIFLIGSHNLVDGCRTYCDQPGGTLGSDYYITITGDHNIVLNSRAEKLDNTINDSSHGIGAKGTERSYSDWGVTTTYNLFENNYSMGSQECFYSRNTRADYNVFRNNEAAGFGTGTQDGLGISNQTGAQHNTYEGMYVHDLDAAFRWVVGLEGGTDPANLHTSFNVIRNSVIEDVGYISRFANDSEGAVNTYEGNRVYNSTFRNVGSLSRGAHRDLDNFSISNNSFVNCLFINVAEDSSDRLPRFSDMFSVDHANFFGGMDVPSWATNTASVDPMLDAELRPTAASPSSIVDEGLDVPEVRYDFDRRERALGSYSLGAFEGE